MTESAAPDNSSSSNNEASGVSHGPNSTAGGKIPAVVSPPSYSGTKHKIDFDGHEVELDYETLLKDFKKHATDAYTYKQQLAQMSPLQEFAAAIKSGNLDVLAQYVPDDVLRNYSEKKLLDYIETQNMDPRERAIREREAKLEAMERQYEAQEKAKQEALYETERTKAHAQVQQDLVDAIKKASGGDDAKLTPRYARRVAENMYAKLSAGQQIDPAAAARQEWLELGNEYNEYQSTMLRRDQAAFIASLPPELVKAIRQHDLSSSRPFKAPESNKEDGPDFVPDVKKPVDVWKQMDRHFDKQRKKYSNQ